MIGHHRNVAESVFIQRKISVTGSILENKENLQKHIHEAIPEEYQKCMVGMKRNLKQTLEIAATAADPRVIAAKPQVFSLLKKIYT